MVVGKGGIGQSANFLVGDFVQVHVGQDVVGLGGPPHGAVAQGLTHLAFLYQVFLPREVARDVAEGGCSIQEVALHVLGLGQHVPGVVQIGVVFIAREPLLILGVASLAALAFGFLLDGVQGDGLLHFLDRTLKAAAGLRRFGVGTRFGRMHVQVL